MTRVRGRRLRLRQAKQTERNLRRRERPARYHRQPTAWSNHWARLLKERGGW